MLVIRKLKTLVIIGMFALIICYNMNAKSYAISFDQLLLLLSQWVVNSLMLRVQLKMLYFYCLLVCVLNLLACSSSIR